MQLTDLQHKLTKQLTTKDIEIKEAHIFSMPLHTVQITYRPVQRSAMDILMKMMLISYEKAKIADPAVLAHILLVEPLFIHDLTNKMLRTGMLTKEDEIILLTNNGRQQKAAGIFEEQLEPQVSECYYSPLHANFLTGDVEEATDVEDFPEVFPYAIEELGEIADQLNIDYLTDLQPAPDEDTPQTFITTVEHYESIQIHDIPILQFICYEISTNRYFVRVYNVLTNEWDTTIEEIVHTKERQTWASKFE